MNRYGFDLCMTTTVNKKMSVNVTNISIIIISEQEVKCMDIFAFLLLQIINSRNWNPEFGQSKEYKNWIAVLDIKTCIECRIRHGAIWLITEEPKKQPPLHPNCRCVIIPMKTVKAGTATINGINGADWSLKYDKKLPGYYITKSEAEKIGYIPNLGNLKNVSSNAMIFSGAYKNRNKHLPNVDGRVWYEADINYQSGYRNTQRVVWSNDGLIFVTYDHYKTFFQIV